MGIVGHLKGLKGLKGLKDRANAIAVTLAKAAVILGLVSFPAAVHATPITYTVNQIVGPGNFSGTITTDGTLGTLAAGNILNWNFSLFDGTASGTLTTGLNGGFVSLLGTPVTATATTLSYNYSLGAVNIFGFGDAGLPNPGGQICYTSFSNCWGPPGVGLYNTGNDGLAVFIPQSGVHIIASGGVSAPPVPAPGALALLAFGLIGVGAFRRNAKAA